MLFNSFEFIALFLPIVLAGYFLINRYGFTTIGKTWLVVASLFFYAYWKLEYLPLILISMAINFAIGMGMQRIQSGEVRNVHRKTLLIIGIAFNLFLLGYFKYANFFLNNWETLSGQKLTNLHIILPLAISFFTFQQISYLVDCYQDHTLEYDFLNYSLFVSFFPQLIAGPIVHHGEMMPQFERSDNKRFQWENFTKGFFIFIPGLAKKVIIADSFGNWAGMGYHKINALSTYDTWVTTLSYTFQIYFDFSGYTDMAIGAALMFNINLPLNFNSPYKAHNLQDFWRRWHMTLSRWLRDYVYIPLGGNRGGEPKTMRNLFLTFLIGGLWHGANWTFVVWGALHGLALVFLRLFHRLKIRIPHVASVAITFLFVHITWIYFRADTLEQANQVLLKLFAFHKFHLPGSIAAGFVTLWKSGKMVYHNLDYLVFLIAAATLAFIGSNSQQMAQKPGALSSVKNMVLTGGLIFACFLFSITAEKSHFLYFNF